MGAFEEAVAEPGSADAADLFGGELIVDVDGYGVHADYDDREGPCFMALDVDDQVEEREGPEADGSAVEGPVRRTEAFNDGQPIGSGHNF